jgi:hypothetical protein
MLVSDVMGDVYNDVRQLLNTTTDANIYIPWVNRVQKDVLHTSLFNYLTQATESFTTTQDTSVYTLSTPVRRIILVYDRTFDRIIQDLDDILAPKQDATSPAGPSINGAMLSAETMTQWPVYYRRTGNTSITLYPAPQKNSYGGAYEITYEGLVPNVVNTTDTLTVPDDGRDVMVAGVNAMAMSYLKLYDESQKWSAEYERMKNGIAVK